MYRPSFLVPFFLFAIFASSPNHARAQQDGKGVADAQVATDTRANEIYRRDCLVCHGPNGDGKTDILRDRELNLPDWTDPKSLGGRVDQQLFNSIRFGRGKMPSESVGRADDAEVRGLIRYIRTIARNEAAVNATGSTTSPK